MAKIAHNSQVLINVFFAFWTGTVLKTFRDLCNEIGTQFFMTRAQFATKIGTLCYKIGTQNDKLTKVYKYGPKFL
jgi:hypothetical protein